MDQDGIEVSVLKKITDKQYDEYMRLLDEKQKGRLLRPLTIRSICQAYDYDPTKIGQHFLELLPRILTPEEQEPWRYCDQTDDEVITQ